MTSRLFLPALALFAGLSGCADVTGYPSLAPRPIEREVMQADAVPPAPPATPAPLPPSADVAAVVERGRAADSAFRAALEKARPQIEAGRRAAEGSEAWVAAQQAYSDVDATSAPLAEALAELDLRRQAATDANDGAGAAAIGAALDELQGLFDAERAQLAALMPA
jgi:hypothetical protein